MSLNVAFVDIDTDSICVNKNQSIT